jgi:fatty acid desaturase
MEWLLAPVMLTANYHLLHHLQPWLPFYRLVQAWWRNEDVHLENNAVIATAFGKTLTPQEYRESKHAKRAGGTEIDCLQDLFVVV